jgi:hypothetical protein
MATPILDLDTLANRPVVIFEEREYWLRTPEILPPLKSYTLKKTIDRLAELETQKDLSDDEQKELQHIPDRLCRLVLDAPDEVHAKLSDDLRTLVVQKAITNFQSGPMFPPQGAGPTSPAAESVTGAT